LPKNDKPIIRVIASDWGKVVADFDNLRMAGALEHHATPGEFDAVRIHEIMLREQREVYDAYMRGQITSAGFRRAMRRFLQLTCTDTAFDAAFVDVFTLNAPIIELWKSLRAQGVKMVAASNVEELRHKHLVKLGVHDLFDKHCLSYQIGRIKPEPEFFHEVARLAYIDPREILFVDDHKEFVEVAERQLMQGITYDLKDHAAFLRRLEDFEFAPYQR